VTDRCDIVHTRLKDTGKEGADKEKPQGESMFHRARTALIYASYGLIPERAPGQGLTEYGLILALVVIVCIVAISAFGTGVSRLMNKTVSSLS